MESKDQEYSKYKAAQERLFIQNSIAFDEFLKRIGAYYRKLYLNNLN